MITRDELKVGETYLSNNGAYKRTVLYIGDEECFYKYQVVSEISNGESSSPLTAFLRDNYKLSKPKEMLELAMFISITGDIIETQIGSDRYGYYIANHLYWRQISKRMIEVDV